MSLRAAIPPWKAAVLPPPLMLPALISSENEGSAFMDDDPAPSTRVSSDPDPPQ